MSSQSPLQVQVSLKNAPYTVHIGNGLLAKSGHLVAEALGQSSGRCALVTDSNVGPLYGETVRECLAAAGFDVQTITVPAGESSKSMEQTEEVCREMIRAGHDRSSFVVALGGGVIGDLAGFVAAIYFRGIPCVQIPTTVVAQVDSSVGGKTGVNAAEGKNLIGAFHQPAVVLADVDTLATLPDREYNEGFAEIIKHAAIRDAEMLSILEGLDGRDHLAPLIERNVRIKAAIVEEDEKELSGTRALLNFGHTIGHGIEASAGYGSMFHGEAISLGTSAALMLSCQESDLNPDDARRVRALLQRYALPLSLPDEIQTPSIIDALRHDKKFRSGQISFVLLRALGDAFVSRDISFDQITAAIEFLRPQPIPAE